MFALISLPVGRLGRALLLGRELLRGRPYNPKVERPHVAITTTEKKKKKKKR